MEKINKPHVDPETAAPGEKPAADTPSTFSDDRVENPSGIKEKTLLRKLDRKLLPAVTLLYLLSFLDRSNGASSL